MKDYTVEISSQLATVTVAKSHYSKLMRSLVNLGIRPDNIEYNAPERSFGFEVNLPEWKDWVASQPAAD